MHKDRLILPHRWSRAGLDWLCQGRSDYREFQLRKQTRAYRIRRSWCKDVWIGSGLLMITNPTLPFIIVLGMLTTFYCFVLLDETDTDR